MTGDKVRRVERLNYLIGGVLIIGAALTQPRAIALGVTVGVILTCLNFFFLRRLVTRWTRDAARGVSSSGGVLMVPKMIALMVAVVLSLAFLPISPAAFALGYSVFVASIFIEAVLELTFENPDESHG